MRTRHSVASAPRVLALVLSVLALACGRRATQADCQLIVDRSVELQMKEMSENDPTTIAKREAEVRAELDDEIKSCESERRVTEQDDGVRAVGDHDAGARQVPALNAAPRFARRGWRSLAGALARLQGEGDARRSATSSSTATRRSS